MAEKMICTSEYETCEYGTLDENNKARIKVYCSEKGKTFYFGEMISCVNRVSKGYKSI